MRVLVCGGRNVGHTQPGLSGPAAARDMARASAERKFLASCLSQTHEKTPIRLVIASKEGGAGSIGLNWASANKIEAMAWRRLKFPKPTLLSSIKSLGKRQSASDYILETCEALNVRMIDGSDPNLVLAFGGGEATRLLVNRAKDKGIKVVEIKIPELELA